MRYATQWLRHNGHVILKCVWYKTAPSHLSVLRMNQTEEYSTKRVFDAIISYYNAVGKLLLDFLAGLTVFFSSFMFIL